jgi:hypothetical protein
MNKSLTVAIAFSLALTCAAAAKSAASVHVPLPRNNPLKQNSPPASVLFSEKRMLADVGITKSQAVEEAKKPFWNDDIDF